MPGKPGRTNISYKKIVLIDSFYIEKVTPAKEKVLIKKVRG
jgi:hypothetical protein